MNLLDRGYLHEGCIGVEVQELQIILSGFNGTIPDGDFGSRTEMQVKLFQSIYMNMRKPDGVVGPVTMKNLLLFGQRYPLNFDVLKCPCGECNGFGNNLYKNQYKQGKPRIERLNLYEYPGIHKIILWSYKAAQFYIENTYSTRIEETSGYRCSIDNRRKGRTSTNHHGKAIDSKFKTDASELRFTNMYTDVEKLLLLYMNCQVGWAQLNKKAIEPNFLSPTWLHIDCRSFEGRYLLDNFFVKSEEELMSPLR